MKQLWLITGLLFLLPLTAKAQEDTPKVEVFTGYSYLRADGERDTGTNLNGWNVSMAVNAKRWLGFVSDFSGHYGRERFFNAGGEIKRDQAVHTFLFGPRFSFRNSSRVTPFAQALFGGVHGRNEGDTFINPPSSQTAFGLAAGGGLDIKVNDTLAFRVVQADYLLGNFKGNRQNNARLSTGLVFRIGSK
jgi:opacity protein-like surface antigen